MTETTKMFIWMAIALIDTYIIIKSDMKEPGILSELHIKIKKGFEALRTLLREGGSDYE